MDATNALIPIQNPFNFPASISEFRMGPGHNLNRPKEAVLLRVYSPDDSIAVYGPDGEDKIEPRTGEHLDMYV